MHLPSCMHFTLLLSSQPDLYCGSFGHFIPISALNTHIPVVSHFEYPCGHFLPHISSLSTHSPLPHITLGHNFAFCGHNLLVTLHEPSPHLT